VLNDRCFLCKNYFGDLSCMAFKVIPNEIMNGDNNHDTPLKSQDNYFVFEDKKNDGFDNSL